MRRLARARWPRCKREPARRGSRTASACEQPPVGTRSSFDYLGSQGGRWHALAMRSGFALSVLLVAPSAAAAYPADGDAEAVVGVEALGRDAAARAAARDADAVTPRTAARATAVAVAGPGRILARRAAVVRGVVPIAAPLVHRSEEHTSELQSLRHLVCR